MKTQSIQLPAGELKAVGIYEFGGAWFVTYEATHGARLRILKRNGRPKGFRSLDVLVSFLRFACEVKTFTLTAQLPKAYK